MSQVAGFTSVFALTLEGRTHPSGRSDNQDKPARGVIGFAINARLEQGESQPPAPFDIAMEKKNHAILTPMQMQFPPDGSTLEPGARGNAAVKPAVVCTVLAQRPPNQ
jgi:hypothetical protein